MVVVLASKIRVTTGVPSITCTLVSEIELQAIFAQEGLLELSNDSTTCVKEIGKVLTGLEDIRGEKELCGETPKSPVENCVMFIALSN